MPNTSASVDQARVAVLIDNLDYAFDKLAWHGPNLMGSLRGVDARGALRRLHGRRSIWEQTLHCAYWKQRVVNKLIGTQPFPRRGTDWPDVPAKPDARLWRADIALLVDIQKTLRDAVRQLGDRAADPAIIKLVLGAAAHDIYHTGQIRLLRRMLGLARKSGN